MKRSCGEASKHPARAQTSRDYLMLLRCWVDGVIVDLDRDGAGAGVGVDLGADGRERGTAWVLDLVGWRWTDGVDR